MHSLGLKEIKVLVKVTYLIRVYTCGSETVPFLSCCFYLWGQWLPFLNPETNIMCSVFIPHTPLSVCLFFIIPAPHPQPLFLKCDERAWCQSHGEIPIKSKQVPSVHVLCRAWAIMMTPGTSKWDKVQAATRHRQAQPGDDYEQMGWDWKGWRSNYTEESRSF